MTSVSEKHSSSKPKPVKNTEMMDKIVNNRYKLGDIIGKGSFGELRRAIDMTENQMVAAKLEKIVDKRISPLEFEYQCYKMVGSDFDGFPKVYFFGKCGLYHVLVMELLDRDLETVFNSCGRQFSLKTILYIFIQLLQRIEWVHTQRLVFRDVKPENFILGLRGTPKENIIHIIDFGLAKQYLDPDTKTHIPMETNRQLTGTARYMSLNSHYRREQSRRDDLESIGYMMLYFLRQGKLPWSGLTSDTPKQRYEKIGLVKASTSIEYLCYGFPEPFHHYMIYVRCLDFKEEPNYQILKTLFIKLYRKEMFPDDGLYDWN